MQKHDTMDLRARRQKGSAFQDSSPAIDRSIDAPRSTNRKQRSVLPRSRQADTQGLAQSPGRQAHPGRCQDLSATCYSSSSARGSLPAALPPLVLCRRRRTTAHDRLGENAHLPRNATQITRMHLVRIALCAMIGCCLPVTAVAT